MSVRSSASSGGPRPGEVVAGKYRVERLIGQGGMGIVVAAKHLVLGDHVALKFLLPAAPPYEKLVERFLREARVSARIKSEHTARVLDVGTLEGGKPFIVMELLEGLDLGRLVRERGPLPPLEVVDCVLQACKDDSQVELDWHLSTGFDHSETKTSATPLWDGDDVWKVSASSVNGKSLDAPLYSDVHAYVSGGTLVASIPEMPIPLPIGGDGHLSFNLTGAGLLGTLFYDEEVHAYRLLNGQVVGRLKLTDVFASMSAFRFADGTPLCTDNPLYSIAKSNFCNSADILAEPGTPSNPCDAVSFAIGFEADPAKLGAVDATTPITAPGCPASTDPANDSCPP